MQEMGSTSANNNDIMGADDSKTASNDSIIIDFAKVVSSMKINPCWSHATRMSWEIACIFAVPKILSRHNERAYKPTAFSIGPLHHSDETLRKHTHNIKIHYLTGLVTRVGIKVEELIAAVADIESKARAHYRERLTLSPSKLVEILVLDGCFLIELFRKCADPSFERELDDPVFSMPCMTKYLLHDMMLLENQIPWMVLDVLFNLTGGIVNSESYRYPLALLALLTYQEAFPIKLPVYGMNTEQLFHFLGSVRGRHILELLRNALIHSTSTPKTIIKDGVLKVSPIRIDDTTEALFRNIIAFEQCLPWCPPAFTSYAILLDNLINTTDDLEQLRRKGIITYMLNPQDALKFFNRLFIDTSFNTFYYPEVCKDIHDYCQKNWPQHRAVLVRNYLSSPWVIVSTFAAFALLVLTFLQTVYTVKR